MWQTMLDNAMNFIEMNATQNANKYDSEDKGVQNNMCSPRKGTTWSVELEGSFWSPIFSSSQGKNM